VDLLPEGGAEVEAEAVQLNRKRTEFAGKPGLPDVIIWRNKVYLFSNKNMSSAEEL
jgi:hypothetical protein